MDQYSFLKTVSQKDWKFQDLLTHMSIDPEKFTSLFGDHKFSVSIGGDLVARYCNQHGMFVPMLGIGIFILSNHKRTKCKNEVCFTMISVPTASRTIDLNQFLSALPDLQPRFLDDLQIDNIGQFQRDYGSPENVFEKFSSQGKLSVVSRIRVQFNFFVQNQIEKICISHHLFFFFSLHWSDPF
jgi:hypothetical protein